jgi:hypothetical protein
LALRLLPFFFFFTLSAFALTFFFHGCEEEESTFTPVSEASPQLMKMGTSLRKMNTAFLTKRG